MTRRRAGGERADGCAGRRHRQLTPTSRDHSPFTPVLLLAAALGLLSPAALATETYDPPVTTMVTNMLQSSGSDRLAALYKGVSGLQQRFRTGPNPAGYELDGITLYVRDTRESRYMTIVAGLYRRIGSIYSHVTNLSRGQLDDFAHNQWQAPADTYLKPDTDYAFVLDCVDGCANDNIAQFGVTYSKADDSGAEAGWSVHDFLVFRRVGGSQWYSDPGKVLRIRVKGRPSAHRAYKTEIVSSPQVGRTYRYGENIDIALTFNAPVYVAPGNPTSIAIRLGNAVDGPTYRAAAYASGSGTSRLVFRYQVQLDDVDTNGISVDAGSSNTGYSGWVPTLVHSLGLLPVDRYFPGVPDHGRHKVDGSFHVTGVEITSTTAHADGYRLGEDIEVTLTFSVDAYVTSDDSVVAVRVGDGAADSSYRSALYASGSGTPRLAYRYRVQVGDFDTDGISVDAGGPHSGFRGPLPVTSPALGSLPTSRGYPRLEDDARHKVDLPMTAAFDAAALTISESGTAASVTVVLDSVPKRPIAIPIIVTLGDGASADDYSLSASSAIFAPGEREKVLTLTAVDDGEDDDGETLTIAFGALPSGIRAGAQSSVIVAIADDDGDATGQTVTIGPGRDAYIAGLDDIVFNLTLAEAADQAIPVNVRLTQDQPFVDAGNLMQRVEFAANATAAELLIPASQLAPGVSQGGTLTATVIVGPGYQIGTPATAHVRMAASTPALIARLSQTLYSFEEGATDAEASVDVVMETEPGLPPPNRSHAVTVSTEAGTATADADYVPVNAILTFAPEDYAAADGRWVARKSVALPLVDDGDDEPDEQFTVTLSSDASLGDLVQARNPNRTRCDGPCQARIVIADNDVVGVSFLDGDGNPLVDFRLTVPEGEQVTYRMKLDRRPAQWGLLVREPGDGDADLVPQGDRSWPFSPDAELSPNLRAEPGVGRNAHHWQEAFTVTVEALQDNDAYPGERRFHNYLVSGDLGQTRIELPDIVVVEIDDEGSGPLRVFGTPEVISAPVSGDTYELGERIEIQVVFTRPVTVTGSPYLEFDLGSPDAPQKARANFAGGDGTQDLVFGYTVRSDDRDDDGIEIPAGSIHLNDGAIQDVESGTQAAIEYAASGVQAAHGVRGPAALAVADAQTAEKTGATLDFAVTLSRAVSQPAMVEYATADGTATAGQDYAAANGTLIFAAGQTRKTVSVAVLDDARDEGAETLTLTLSNASGALIVDDAATGTIVNHDPLPQAWLARFGRTVAEQVMEAVEGRLQASGAPGVEMTLAGQAVGAPGPKGEEAQSRPAAMTDWLRGGMGRDGERLGYESRSASGRELLTGSSFALTGEAPAVGTVSLWGRGALSRFDGREGDLSLDGEVTSVMLGADWTRDPGSKPGAGSGMGAWTAGLLVSRSEGVGSYRGASESEGKVESTLTGVHPYGRYMLNGRVTLWGVAGYGAGELSLRPKDAAAIRTDMDLVMGALGARGVAVEAPAEGGLELTVTSDALAVRTASEKAEGLEAATADVTRLRLGLEGTWRGLALGEAGTLVPRLEIGVRHDGGDAETGFGLDLGGGLAWSDPKRGLAAEVSGRGLLTHESRGFRDRGISGSFAWEPGGGTGRGPSVTLSQTVGSSATSGMDALLGRETLAGLAANDDGNELENRRLELRLGYGFAAFGDRFTATPELGLGLSNGQREYSLGWRLDLAGRGPTALDLRLEATRREAANDNVDPEHGVGLGVTARW